MDLRRRRPLPWRRTARAGTAIAVAGVGVALALPVSGASGAVIDIQANVDGRSDLRIMGEHARWRHFTFMAPGEQGTGATRINGASWTPIYGPGTHNGCGGCLSDVFTGVSPPLPTSGVTFEAVSCRQSCRADIAGGIATIHFDDTLPDGAALYHVRLTWSAVPVVGRAVNVGVVNGQVLVKQPGQGFVPLGAGQQIPLGSLVDTTRGTVRLTSAANARGTKQTGDFTAGLFQVKQSRSGGGLTDLNLSGGSFRGCAVGASGRAGAARSSRVVRRLKGKARGRFRTRGRYSAATVRGTNWTVTDRCDGTLTSVKTGTVTVRDFRKHRNVTVHAGHSYLARAG